MLWWCRIVNWWYGLPQKHGNIEHTAIKPFQGTYNDYAGFIITWHKDGGGRQSMFRGSSALGIAKEMMR